MYLIFFAVLGYLSGSIPFGLLLTRWAGLGDVRTIGSGNIGATNVLRTGNKKIAALTLFCDGLKGFAPVLLAREFGGPTAATVAGLAALAGHVLPLWLKFKGGKGVATGLGVLLGLNWLSGVVFAAVWLAMFFSSRISSLSALAAITISVPAAIMLDARAKGLSPWTMTWELGTSLWPVILLIAIVIWFTHRANILRLVKGEEPKASFTKKP